MAKAGYPRGRRRRNPVWRSAAALLTTATVLMGAASILSFAIEPTSQLPRVHSYGSPGHSAAGSSRVGVTAGCNIKGNISMNTGERIYHMPGQKYYAATRVNPAKGERWFCSEWEAWMAGWRRSKV